MEFIVRNQVFFIGVLGIVTFVLSIYLGLLIRKLKAKNIEQKTLLEEHMQQAQEKAEYYKESILIIAKATIQGDCEISEACIRIQKLLVFFPEISKEEEFSILQEMFQELNHLAYLDERKKLSKNELNNEDQQRFKIEGKFKDRFLIVLKNLIVRVESLA